MNIKLGLSALAILPIIGGSAMAAGQTGIINYEFVNIRSNNNANDSVKFVLKKGDKVEILSEKDGWYNIKHNNRNGWVQKNALKIENSVQNNIKASGQKNKYKEVNNDILNLRSANSTGSDVIAVLHKGDKLTVINETVGWTKVKFNDMEGYVSSRLIKDYSDSGTSEKFDSNTVSSTDRRVVSSNKLNMRKSSEITSPRVATLSKGDMVQYISENNGWAKIKYNGIVGYVSSYYLVKDTSNVIEESIINENEINVDENNNDGYGKSNENTKQGTVSYKNMNMTLDEHVNLQMARALNVDSGSGWKKVDAKLLSSYMNPNNYKDSVGMMQFAVLDSYTEDLTAEQLNAYLNKYCKPGNVFYNQGQAFINAARKNNINVLYLVGHSMIETGYGTSRLARGSVYNGKTVYNFFGIGAVDGNAYAGGCATAYKNGWTSVAAGIDGAASWISNKYIHNSKYNQKTLYEMKWSTSYTWHQYASDISWPSKIGKKMAEIGSYSSNLGAVNYLVPQYN